MKLLVLGASGQCGSWVVKLARARGDDVTAFVRPATPYEEPSGVRVVRGDVLRTDDVRNALGGQEAVLSCVGPQRVNPANPFSPLKSPPNFCERSARVIASALEDARVRRLGVISAAGVADSAGALPWIMKWLLRHSTIGPMYADLGAMEQVYSASRLDWFAVRPVTLINAAPSTRAREIERFRAASVISRADVAAYMLTMLGQPVAAHRRTPLIGWW